MLSSLSELSKIRSTVSSVEFAFEAQVSLSLSLVDDGFPADGFVGLLSIVVVAVWTLFLNASNLFTTSMCAINILRVMMVPFWEVVLVASLVIGHVVAADVSNVKSKCR